MEKICSFCGRHNHPDNFKCEGEYCGAPLDLEITFNEWGLPDITPKKNL